MRTRCPECSTVFRVTPEQLRLKAGKVRCGQCHGVFNAFETLIEDSPPALPADTHTPEATPEPLPAATPAEIPPPAPSIAPMPATVPAEAEPVTVIADAPPARQEPILVEPSADVAPLSAPPQAAPVEPPSPPGASAPEEAPTSAVDKQESVEETTEAARAAGLVAARELSDTPAFNRWAAGTLAGDAGNFRLDEHQPSRLPFLITALLLTLLLLGQAAYQWRTAVVQRLPDAAGLYQALGVDIPLPRISDLVAIESSDLQFDKARGLLVLQATLHNRAAFAQDWPALELTLTDTQDTVITRRVLNAADYLPPGTDLTRFAGRAELAIRLWLEAREIGAAGYRLYIFYP